MQASIRTIDLFVARQCDNAKKKKKKKKKKTDLLVLADRVLLFSIFEGLVLAATKTKTNSCTPLICLRLVACAPSALFTRRDN